MPSRMENRENKIGHKRLAWIIGIATLLLLIVGGLAYAYSGTEDNSTKIQPKSAKLSKKSSSKSSKAASESTLSSSFSQTDTPDLTGLGFQIMPILFNGEDVNQAMNDNKAPQNTVHDGSQLGYFSNRTQARVTGIAGYMYAHTVSYGINKDMLSLNSWRIPLSVVNGELQIAQWKAKDYDGNTITWKLEPLSDAKSVVEAHENSNDKSASSNETNVDPHNLTTAQMEHWVRSYLESNVPVYDASDYTFTQKFVDGYAEIYEYQKTQSSGESELVMTYRVDENGNLAAANPNADHGWQVVSKRYQ